MKSSLVRSCAFWSAIISLALLCAPRTALAQVWPACGTPLFSPAYRGVDAKSNHVVNQAHAISCDGGGPYGLQYQCVEYIRRFYGQVENIDTSDSTPWAHRNAQDFFAAASVLNLVSFKNGSATESPRTDDILVFKGPKGEIYGHISIVSAVDATSVSIIEQNWNPTGQAKLLLTQAANGAYSVTRVGSSYTVLGWMRKRSAISPIVYQPANDIGVQDIWTTSFYSYTGLGGGPGGGLNDDRLRVGGWGDLYYSLLEFDLSTLPSTASKVELQVYMPLVTGAGTTALYLDRITAFWDWRTQGTGQDRLRLWWADRPSVVQWIAAALPAPTAGQWYAIDVTSLYNAWKAGTYPNYGVQLRPVGAGNNTWTEFVSSNSSDTSHHPRLVVTP